MKKTIMVLSILCGGLLVANPIVTSFAQDQTNVVNNKTEKSNVEVVKELNIDQAKEVLEIYNPSIKYSFQGDENTFTVLKDKGLEGYVFLGNVDGDLGYFVDKNSANVYYFHPSGYLDIIL